MKILLINSDNSQIPLNIIKWFFCKTGFIIETNEELISSCSIIIIYGTQNDFEDYNEMGKPIIFIPEEKYSPEIFLNKKPKMLYIEQDTAIPIWGNINSNENYQPYLTKNFTFDFTTAISTLEEKKQIFFNFDPLINIWFHLLREEEKVFLKENKKFSHEHSILLNYLHIPVVDYLIAVVKATIINIAQQYAAPLIHKKRWPKGQDYAFSISYDVDLTRKWGPKKVVSCFFTNLFKLKINKICKMMVESIFKENIYWTFPKIIEINRSHNWSSTFFFIAKSFEKTSYRYNIGTKKFKKLFKELIENKNEVALHNSLKSFGNRSKVKKELFRLKYFSEKTIQGIRQHHLNLQFPKAFTFFAGLHFKYDSSMAYPKTAGYRASTTLPYPIKTEGMGEIYEIPFLLFDYHLNNIEDWKEYFKRARNHCETTGGLLHILWHPSNIAETPLNEKFFSLIKKLFEAENNCCNFSLIELTNWAENWDNIQFKVLPKKRNCFRVVINSSQNIDDLVFEIIGTNQNHLISYPELEVENKALPPLINLNLKSNNPLKIDIEILH